MTRPSLSGFLLLLFAFAAFTNGMFSYAAADHYPASWASSPSPTPLATSAMVVDTVAGFRLTVPSNVERVKDGGAALIFVYPNARSVTLVSTFQDDLPGWFDGKDTSLAQFVRMVFDPSTPIDIPLGDVAQEMREALLHGETKVLSHSAGRLEVYRLMLLGDPASSRRERAFVISDTLPHAQLEVSAKGLSAEEFEEILSSLSAPN